MNKNNKKKKNVFEEAVKKKSNLKWSNATRKISDLIPYTDNPRKMSPEQAQHLLDSLEKFNLVEIPAINLNNKILAGHMRMSALKSLGRGNEIIDVRIPNRRLTEEEEKEYLLRSNKNRGDWDQAVLRKFNEELLIDVGFGPNEIDDIVGPQATDKDPDSIPALPGKAKAKLGDLYRLGRHSLYCGDATDPATFNKLLGSTKIDMVFTDPPYNVNYKGKGKNTSEGIKNDHISPEDFKEFSVKIYNNMGNVMKPGAVYYICSGWSSYPVFHESLLSAGFYRAGVIIWVKDNASYGWNDYRYKHEWIVVGKKKAEKTGKACSIMYGWKSGSHYFRDTRDEYDIWHVPRKSSNNYEHPTEKPVWLIEKALANSSLREAAILDTFGGSGSTLIACERLNRTCYMMELDMKYADVIIARWEKFTGEKATKIN